MLVSAVVSLIALGALTVVQAQLPPAEREEFWSNELKLEDPAANYPSVYLNIPEQLKTESQTIQNLLVGRNLTEVIERAPKLLASLGELIGRPPARMPMQTDSSLDYEQQIMLLVQTICMFKIKAETMRGQYFEALIDATKFFDYCTSRPGKCVTTQPFERIAQRVSEFVLAGKYPAEILGLSEEELADGARLKSKLERIVGLLQPDLHGLVNQEQKRNIQLMHDLAVKLYQQLLPPKKPAFSMHVDLPDEDFFDDILELATKDIAEKRTAGRYFEALRDITKYISSCTDEEQEYYCTQVDEAKQLQDDITNDIDSLIEQLYLGWIQKSPIEMKLYLLEARKILHPDKNSDLSPDQRKFMGDMFIEVNKLYDYLRREHRLRSE